jgi:hypothetical protein
MMTSCSLFQMQKLVLLALFFTLAMVSAKRPNYSKQGRSKEDACRLNCVWDAVSCGFPCRLLFRSHRAGYFNCAKGCNSDRIACFRSCERKVIAPAHHVVVPALTGAVKTTAGHGNTATGEGQTATNQKATEPEAAQEEEVDGEENGDSNESVED